MFCLKSLSRTSAVSSPVFANFVRTSYLKTKKLPCTLANVKQIDLSYGGLSQGTTGLIEFYYQANGKKIKATNPEAKFNVHFDNRVVTPTCTVTYKNGDILDLEPMGKSVNQIYDLLKNQEKKMFMEVNKPAMEAYKKKHLSEVLEGVQFWTNKHEQMIQEINQNEKIEKKAPKINKRKEYNRIRIQKLEQKQIANQQA
ncbi:hypothetical protein WA158_006246 [Blastocystis sp. Blastoise]